MLICTSSNGRTAAAAENGLNRALRVAFNAGAVMGLSVVCLGLGALSILLMAFNDDAIAGKGALAGFGMGASTVSIIARVGGGIYTKAADVGADLVGKVEKNLPEDDARNPATIADNVGDNVGDVAGMGADLFSSFVGSIVASSLLGNTRAGQRGIAVPFWISMSGIVAAFIGVFLVRCKENATQRDLLTVLRTAQLICGLFQVGFMALVIWVIGADWQYFCCIVIGLGAGLALGIHSEYFTSYAFPPTVGISQSGRIGAANVIIEGLSVGMYSCVLPALIIASVIISCMALAGSYGIALASTGLLSTLGMTLATDAYGPVADNAGGIAEMTHMPEHTRKNTDVLDALGNTTAAIGKGFAVGSAVLTAVSLLNTFKTRLNLVIADPIQDRFFIAGCLVGAVLPFFFGGLTMSAVNKAAQAVVMEVRRQFQTINGLAEGRVDPDYAACVGMITKGALHAMVFPALLVILAPIIIGIGLGPSMLAGMLIGAIVCGFMLGLMMSTAGGSWDNAKKYVELGHYGGKKSLAHKATVVGDTVGDPFKDTSGPAINIQIKLMSYISVVLVPVWRHQADYWWAALIIIGIMMVFVPVWIKFMTPQALTSESINKVVDELAKADPGVEVEVLQTQTPQTQEEKNQGGEGGPAKTSQREHEPLIVVRLHEAPSSPHSSPH
jgi:H(+)-translocating pyrophosphatase